MSTTNVGATVAPSELNILVAKLQNVLKEIQSAQAFVAPVETFFPASAPILSGIEAGAGVASHIIDAIEGNATTDSASLAAGAISSSTGNATLDARLAALELFIEQIAPIMQKLAQHFGFQAPVSPAQAQITAAIAAASISGA